MSPVYKLTNEDKAAIDRGLADAAAGRFATESQVKAVFEKYRLR
jgi:predicted transcriptional regulator